MNIYFKLRVILFFLVGGGGIYRLIVKVKRSVFYDSVSEYRVKKVGGDIKKTGKSDFYVYFLFNF